MKIKTTDIYFASYCVAMGSNLIGLDDTNPKKKILILESHISNDELTSGYWGNKEIPIMIFINSFKSVKNFLYNYGSTRTNSEFTGENCSTTGE